MLIEHSENSVDRQRTVGYQKYLQISRKPLKSDIWHLHYKKRLDKHMNITTIHFTHVDETHFKYIDKNEHLQEDNIKS